MNSLAEYQIVRPSLRPGDLIVFWGGGLVSGLIRLFSAGPSHVAVVRQPAQNGEDVRIIESTIEPGKNGVQTNPLGWRIQHYDAGGKIAWLPLAPDIRALVNWQAFYSWCGACEDRVTYDVGGLFEFIEREIPIIGPRVGQTEHPQKMVCSAFATSLYERSRVLRGINWSKVSPLDLCEMALWRDIVPLLGNPPKIKRFNSV